MDHDHTGHNHGMTMASSTMSMITGDHSGHTGVTDGHSGHAGSGTNGHSMHMSGHMYFYFGKSATILFKDWEIMTVGGLIGSMFAVFFMAMLFEGLKTLREIHAKEATRRAAQNAKLNSDTFHAETPQRSWSWMDSISQTLLHMLQFTWGYLLMLIFMTFNVWLCLSVVLGVGVGYIIFFFRRPIANFTEKFSELGDCCG